MPQRILLIAPEEGIHRVAEALRKGFDITLDVAASRRTALTLLRRGEYALILLEESLAMADAEWTDMLCQSAASAPVLELNFAIADSQRIMRQVKATLARRELDRQRARAAATATLQNELNASLTGLLLESQLALREATPQQAAKLQHVVELAGNLRDRLRAQGCQAIVK